MTGVLRQIVYLSRAHPTCDEEAVRQLGLAARAKNVDYDVTGLLLFDGDRFIQAIEGPAEGVRTIFTSICLDRRHSNIQMATDRIVKRRQFGTWSMQTRKTSVGICSASFLRKVKALMLGVDDSALQALFIGFAILGRKKTNKDEPLSTLSAAKEVFTSE